jgi:Fungal fruit body lectin
MSYTITIRVFQTNTNAFFNIVEKTVWYYAGGGTWTESNGEHVLTMGDSGTSGSLRLVADTGESFFVVFGVHNWKKWGAVVTDLAKDQTGVSLHPQYYAGGSKSTRSDWNQLDSYTVTNLGGRSFTVTYTEPEGHALKCNLIIG